MVMDRLESHFTLFRQGLKWSRRRSFYNIVQFGKSSAQSFWKPPNRAERKKSLKEQEKQKEKRRSEFILENIETDNYVL